MDRKGDEEEGSWTPVRVVSLNYLLLELDTVLQQRGREYQWERDWEKEAAAAAAAGALDAAQRLDLARRLSSVLSLSWYSFACSLRRFEDDLNTAVKNDGDLRPRPDSAYWWRWYYCDGGAHRFVHVSPGQLARARELRADAYARTQRARALVEDLRRRCWWDPAAEHSVPGMMQRFHRVQLLIHAVVLRVQELRRLVGSLVATTRDDHNNTRVTVSVPGGGRGSRGRSVPPRPLLQDAARYNASYAQALRKHARSSRRFLCRTVR